MKETIKKLIFPVLLLAANIVLFYYYVNGLTEYSSVLDRYLNFGSMFMIMAGASVCVVFSAICVVFLIVRIIRIKKDTTKVFPTVLLITFFVLNVACFISVGALHSKSNVVNSVSDSPYSYVAFDALFDERDDPSYHEQTVLFTVNDEIPVNYSIQQNDINGGVQTKCVRISDNDLLELYYDELTELYADYGITDFNSDEAETLGITKGFYYIIDNFELCIVIVKDDSVFNISVDRRIAIDNVIFEQISAL